MKRTIVTVAAVAAIGSLPLAAQQTATEPVVEMEKFEVTGMRSFSDQAISGKTPVAFTEIGKETITAELASRDLPLVMNTTPSVFATTDGGAAGDARVNVRGFSQRNVSILINGVPTNDVENGWLYWSNWDGLGDVTSTIQMQRGLSNVTLPTPSVGGTMNIITDPASNERGGSVKFELGSDDFYKMTGTVSTGLIGGKYALTIGGVAKTGDGYPVGAWTKGYGYYIGATWIANDKNRFELFAVGAPQQHGQRRFASNIAAYDTAFAKKLGYTDAEIAAAQNVGPINAGHEYNQNVAPVSSSYNGLQWYWDDLHAREDSDMLNESVNYFHKPQVNLNWYLTLNDSVSVTSVFYYSGGRGGGSGTLNNGSSSAAFARYPNSNSQWGSNINWDATIASNAGAVAANGTVKAPGRSLGILRNSVNNQDQYGIISKLTWNASEAWTFSTGLDWRTAEIDHFREVRDLLGGEYYLPTAAQASQFWAGGTNTQLRLGDKVDYWNTNEVDWLGLFAQGQYDQGPITAFGVVGYSSIEYGFTDFFRRATPTSNDPYILDPDAGNGYQVKGGVQYRFTPQFSAFVNAGYVDKVPNLDGVINDVSGVLVNADNEEFNSYEVGTRWVSADRSITLSASAYYTEWNKRTISTYTETTDTLTYLRNVDSTYKGIEAEAAWRLNNWIRFDAAASFGDWTYENDVQGEAFIVGTGAETGTTSRIYTAGLKVGDAPQSQIAYGAIVYPVKGLSVKLTGRWYDRYYADFTPESRTNAADRGQAWQIPSYTVYDLNVNYEVPLSTDSYQISLFGHVLNLFDKTHVSDATDNSSFEGVAGAPSHSAQRAEVFLGSPLTFNLGVKLSF